MSWLRQRTRLVPFLVAYAAPLATSTKQELQQRYAGSVLGLTWAMLYPLLLLGFYATVYVVILRVRPPNMDAPGYLVLVLSGLVPLLGFLEALTASTGSLVANRSILLNTVFPAELIPLRSILATQIPSCFALGIVVILALVQGRTSIGPLLVLPILWILLVAFVAGLGWVLALLTLVARDIQQALGIVNMMAMVLSPAAYTAEMVPQGMKALIYFNPLSYFVMCFQDILCFDRLPQPGNLAAAALLGVGSLVAGFWFFQRAKLVFFDYA